ncbi:MAG: response regulator, partial [Anaerolineae bacterium]|nr:response regulator [Anaerolineae bacterium]
MMNNLPAQKILVVDDNQASYNLICDFLAVIHNQRLNPVWAATYDEGLEHIQQQEFDVGLIDYELDKNNGLDFIREVIRRECPTPLILLTGYGNHRIDLEAMQAGAVDYLDKTQLRPEVLERSMRYAVEQSRILKAERDQRTLAEALLDISNALNGTLNFEEVLKRILLNLGMVIPHDTANIMLIENDETRVVGHKGYNLPELEREIANSSFNVKKIRSFAEIIVRRQPLIVPDLLNLSNWLKSLGPHRLRSYMGAPILLGDQIIGLINLESYQPNFFTETHARRLQLFASQSAVAIQNAFAYERAQERAATEERQRLARDLHDAVSQTLFSASVIAETLPRLFEREPAEVQDGLGKLARLTRGALAEMRTLLVELRPTALLEMDLSILIQQLVI